MLQKCNFNNLQKCDYFDSARLVDYFTHAASVFCFQTSKQIKTLQYKNGQQII